MPADVNLLNLNVPARATPATPWHVTRLSPNRYFYPYLKPSAAGDAPRVDSTIRVLPEEQALTDTDVHVLKIKKEVSVTPLSIDLTSRVDLKKLQESFGNLD